MSYDHYLDVPEEEPERPSFSVQTEITILGAMMLDAIAIQDAIGRLRAEDFSLDSHMRIFRCMVDMLRAGKSIDYITVMDALTKRGELDSIGGPAYLAFLTEGIPRNPKIEDYVRIVKEASVGREGLAILNNGMLAMNDREEPALVLERVQGELARLSEGASFSHLEHVGDFLQKHYAIRSKATDRVKGIRTGWQWFDKITNGLVRKKLIIIAARPSIGKTAAAISLAMNMSVKGVPYGDGEYQPPLPGAFFTFEQDKEELSQRLVAMRAGVNLEDLLSGVVDDQIRLGYVSEAIDELSASQLYWDDTPRLSVHQIRAEVKRLKRDLAKAGQELHYILIDQLSFIDISGYRDKQTSLTEWIGAATRDLKLMAKEEDVPVVLLCQLSRSALKNAGNEPTLGDLAISGKIEENADLVLLLHRAEFYDRKDEEVRGKGLLILAKQRQGKTGQHTVLYNGSMCRWIDDPAETAKAEDSYYDESWMGNR